MENGMLEQIQQMITTATDTLRREIVGDLRQEMAGMKGELRQDMAAMEARLGERIDDTKRHSGILVEDLQHKLELVIEGQQFLRQDIANVRSDMDAQTRETRTLIGTAYRDLDRRVQHLEPREQS